MVIETTGTEERRETREARFREKSFSSFSLSNASLDKLISGFILPTRAPLKNNAPHDHGQNNDLPRPNLPLCQAPLR